MPNEPWATRKKLKYRWGSCSDNTTHLSRCLTEIYAGDIARQWNVLTQRVESATEILGCRQLTINAVVRRHAGFCHVRTVSKMMCTFWTFVKLSLVHFMLMERQRQQQWQICHHQNPWCYKSKLSHREFLSLYFATI